MGFWHGIRDQFYGAWRSAERLLYARTVLVLAIAFVVGIIVILVHLLTLSSSFARTLALSEAGRYGEIVSEMRSLYTAEVAVVAEAAGLEVTHEYHTRPGAIPLPISFTLELGRHLEEVTIRLYSPYPFPQRVDSGLRDAFEREAWNYLQRRPDGRYFRFERYDGREVFRYATADRMRPNCVACHNTHPESPRRDWRQGDVRGVLEVMLPMEDVMAEVQSGLRHTFALLVIMSGAGTLALGLVVARLRRTAVELEEQVDRRTAELQSRTLELAQANQEVEREAQESRRAAEALALQKSELEQTRLFLDSVIENLPVMLFVKEADQLRFVGWNRVSEELTGLDREVVMGKNDFDFFPEEQARFFVTQDRLVLSTAQPVDIPEESIQTVHKGTRLIHTRKVPILGPDGRPRYLLGISEDITERRRAEEQLAQAREREIAIGFRIQQALLLDQPPREFPGVRIAAFSQPSQRIDGDFIVFFGYQNCFLDVAIGDVMGKGVPAALLGAATKTHVLEAISRLMSDLPVSRIPSPRDIVIAVHREMAGELIALESFVTLVYARFDTETSRMSFLDCGHTATIHYRVRTDEATLLRSGNLPLGVRADEDYQEISVSYEAGDLVFFYSDGLTEARNRQGELFGVQRVIDLVREGRGLTPDELIDATRRRVVEFTGSHELSDDLTCIAVRLEPTEAPMTHATMEIESNLKELVRARQFVREFCAGALDDQDAGQLELAVTEATSNVIIHAYRGQPGRSIRIEAFEYQDRIAVLLSHSGAAFDPESVREPAFDGSRESGFGVYIMRHSVDRLRFYQGEAGLNYISLVKSRKGTPGAPGT